MVAEYKMASGKVVTDSDIERICREFEKSTWEGHLQIVSLGPAAVSDKPLDAVMVKLPEPMADMGTRKGRKQQDCDNSYPDQVVRVGH